MLFTPPPAMTYSDGNKVIEPVSDRLRKPKRVSRVGSRRLDENIYESLAAENQTSFSRRDLRLRIGETGGLQFRPELVNQRAQQRMTDFLFALDKLPLDLRDQINQLQNELERFGYQLKTVYNTRHSANSVFNDWELGKS